MYYVYLLYNCKQKLHIGYTENLKVRLARHENGYMPETKKYLPVKLHAYFAFNHEIIAKSFQKYLLSSPGKVFLKKHSLEEIL